MPLFQVLRNFVGSEKAVAAGLLVIAATVLTVLGKMTLSEWQDYSLWCLGIYTGGKTVQGAASVMANGRKGKDEASKKTTEGVEA